MTECKTIRQFREERGWSQPDLARRLGVDATAISRWEHGRAVPRARTPQHLAALFGVSVEGIAFGPAEPEPQRGPM